MKADPCLYCGVDVDEPTFMLNDGLCDECEQQERDEIEERNS